MSRAFEPDDQVDLADAYSWIPDDGDREYDAWAESNDPDHAATDWAFEPAPAHSNEEDIPWPA